MASLPWQEPEPADIDAPSARAILDEEFYDLEKIKDRILEYLAVRKLRQERERRIATEDADGKASADPSSPEEMESTAPPSPNARRETDLDRDGT